MLGLDEPVAWSAIVPVKGIDRAKSRLLPAADPARAELVSAFCRDVLTALAGSARIDEVIVVSDDATIWDLAASTGARAVPEGIALGLNAAAHIGIAIAQPGHAIGIFAADLPCLTSAAVDVVLERAAHHERSFVCDTAGTGTTMLFATDRQRCAPMFGERSRARHAASGCTELDEGTADAHSASDHVIDAFRRARRDVDTTFDLWDAQRIGLGPATTQAINRRYVSYRPTSQP